MPRSDKGRPKGQPTDEALESLRRGTVDHYEDPLLYDFEYKDQRNDIEWYCDLIDERLPKESGRVLELGAGTGRITLPIANRGHHIIALDQMESMMQHMGAKIESGEVEDPDPKRQRKQFRSDTVDEIRSRLKSNITALQGDICDIPLDDQSVDIVIAPFNVLMHLYDWSTLLACFKECWRVLKPGGHFACDVLLPDIEWLTWDPDEHHSVTRFRHPKTGERMVYSTNHSYDPSTQICHIRIYYNDAPRGRFVAPKKSKQLVRLAHRQIFPEELRALVTSAGFEIESHTGDFLGLSLRSDIEIQVLLAKKN